MTDRKINPENGLHFRDLIRSARSTVAANAENFEEGLFALERIGRYFHPDGNSLGAHRDKVIKELNIRDDESGKTSENTNFKSLWDIVTGSRNDAMHIGASARHLAKNVIELLILLEDHIMPLAKEAIMKTGSVQVAHVMVSGPTCAKSWMEVGEARKLMLENSFSTIPVYLDGAWYIITDEAIADHLACAESRLESPNSDAIKVARRKCLTCSIDQARKPSDNRLRVTRARTVFTCTTLSEFHKETNDIRQRSDLVIKRDQPLTENDVPRFPALVIKRDQPLAEALVGIISAYDLL